MVEWMIGLTDRQLAGTLAYVVGYLQGVTNLKTYDNEDQAHKEFAEKLLERIEKHAEEAGNTSK